MIRSCPSNDGFQPCPLFLKSNTLKLLDTVELKTAQIVYKARNNLLPGNLQKLFKEREGRYDYGHALQLPAT